MIIFEDIHIRTDLQPGDLGYLTYLHGKIYQEEYGFGLDFEAYVAETVAEFSRQFDRQKDRVWVCEHNGKMIGFLSLFGREKVAQLRYFVILSEYRGLGLGKKLMQLYLEAMHECDYKHSYLLTTNLLTTAIGLYEKFGFRLKEKRKSEGFLIPETELKYELILS